MPKSKLQKQREATEREEYYSTEEGQKKRKAREEIHKDKGRKKI